MGGGLIFERARKSPRPSSEGAAYGPGWRPYCAFSPLPGSAGCQGMPGQNKKQWRCNVEKVDTGCFGVRDAGRPAGLWLPPRDARAVSVSELPRKNLWTREVFDRFHKKLLEGGFFQRNTVRQRDRICRRVFMEDQENRAKHLESRREGVGNLLGIQRKGSPEGRFVPG